MHSQIDNAAAAGSNGIVKPRLVGAVGVMEGQVDGEHAANGAGAHQLGDPLHARCVAV